MKVFITTLYYLIFLFPIGVYAQSIDDYLKEAAENNPELKAQYVMFEASLERVSQVNSLPDPSISFGYFISPIETRVGAQRAKISLSQMFPWFGTLKAKESAATLLAESKYQTFLNAKNQLFFHVKKAYYPIREAKEHIRWQEENIEILETYKILATTAFSNGKGTLSDAIRVDIMIENAETDISLLKEKLKPLSVIFNKLLNRSDTSGIDISESTNIFTVDNLYRRDSLLTNHPLLKSLDNRIESVKATEEVARKNGLPQFGVGIDYAFISQRPDVNISDNGKNALMPMATMTLPIFRKKYKASIKEAQLTQTALLYRKEATKNSLVSSYQMALYEQKKARELDELYNRQIENTKEVIDLLYTAYSNSGKDFEEVLRMQQQLLKYEMAKATAKKQFSIALAELDYLTAK